MALSIKDEDSLEYEWDMSLLHAQLDILNAVRREMAEDQRTVIERFMGEIEDEIKSMVME